MRDALQGAFSCFVNSREDERGSDCMEQFKELHKCFDSHPEIFAKARDAHHAATTCHVSQAAEEDQLEQQAASEALTDTATPTDTPTSTPTPTDAASPPAAPAASDAPAPEAHHHHHITHPTEADIPMTS